MAAIDEVAIVEERLHRHQLDRVHAEIDEMLDHARMGEAGKCPAQAASGTSGSQRREAFDMRLVNDGLGPGDVRPLLIRPRVGRLPAAARLDHHAFRHEGRGVALVERKIRVLRADAIAEQRIVPGDLSVQLLGIGVEQKLVGIETVPLRGRVRPVDAKAVKLARLQAPRHGRERPRRYIRAA